MQHLERDHKDHNLILYEAESFLITMEIRQLGNKVNAYTHRRNMYWETANLIMELISSIQEFPLNCIQYVHPLKKVQGKEKSKTFKCHMCLSADLENKL